MYSLSQNICNVCFIKTSIRKKNTDFLICLQTDAPGPGNYVAHTTVDNNSSSFSKKGTGGFASKVTMKMNI